MSDGVVILVDCDGPLAAFDDKFYELCAASGYELHGGDVHRDAKCTEHRFLTDCIAERVHRDAARDHVNGTRWFRDLPVVEGAVEGLSALLGHPDVDDVFICTKPLEADPHCWSDKAAWVRHHFGEDWLRRLVITPDKSAVRGHVLLDDAPKPEWFPRAEWTPVIYPTSWNAPFGPFSTKTRVDYNDRWDWGDSIELLVEYAREAAMW